MIDDIGSNSKDEIQFDHRVEYKNCLRWNETIEQLIPKIDLMSFLLYFAKKIFSLICWNCWLKLSVN